jgi:hypothetical protein
MNAISRKISSVPFGTFSTDFCSFIAKICILLFFFALASKSHSLLIINNSLSPLSKWRGGGVLSLRAAERAEVTNRIQREFLFNNGIHSQRGVLSLRAAENPFLSLKPPAPKNKLFQTLLTCRDGILAVRWLGDDSH